MATPEDIHEALCNHEEYDELLKKLDSPGTIDDLRATVDAYGSSSSAVFEHELEELTAREVGILRIAWEAHHKEFHQPKPKTS